MAESWRTAVTTHPPSLKKSELFAFLDMAITKGMVNSNTGTAWKAAANKVLSDTSDEDSLAGFDVRAAVLRYNNRNPGDLTGDSLKKYEQRTKTAIEQFTLWKTDPMNYKPPSRGLPGEKDTPKARVLIRRTPVAGKTTAPAPTPPANGMNGHVVPPVTPVPAPAPAPNTTLTIPIPIRKGAFVVQLTIPVDMTTAEAARISAVMTAYAHEESGQG